ncbi:receptor homology region, transmembrane domain- and RING domain-containing protein 1 [Nymphaea colorata]|nr:receptor homology region, transmembrane domain- and RING domain-containing protein 1 [Nymphaea colorata]
MFRSADRDPWRRLVTLFVLLLFLSRDSVAFVILQGSSLSLSFEDVQARFAIPVNGFGICGTLHLAEPLDACSSLLNGLNVNISEGIKFALIIRGSCTFEEKVKNAQDAGFRAAIVYDNKETGSLISMIGSAQGIQIHAVFVSKEAGETLKKFAHGGGCECCINPTSDEATWTVFAMSLFSILVIVAVLFVFFFARNRRRLQHIIPQRTPEINSQLLKILPSFTFSAASMNGKCTSETCSICLEDYKAGETLRALPCNHEFHASCIDSWLTKWRTFCPVCKRDMLLGMSNCLTSESTPLLGN